MIEIKNKVNIMEEEIKQIKHLLCKIECRLDIGIDAVISAIQSASEREITITVQRQTSPLSPERE